MSSEAGPSNSHATIGPSNSTPITAGATFKPQSRPTPRNFEKTYTGPNPEELAPPRTRSQAEKYFARVANENILPNRLSKGLAIGGWVLGGFACGYMALFADYGDREHVFSPLRRHFHAFTNDLFTLSPTERSTMGLESSSPSISSSGGVMSALASPDRISKAASGSSGLDRRI